jgi:hypothetical protein
MKADEPARSEVDCCCQHLAGSGRERDQEQAGAYGLHLEAACAADAALLAAGRDAPIQRSASSCASQRP